MTEDKSDKKTAPKPKKEAKKSTPPEVDKALLKKVIGAV